MPLASWNMRLEKWTPVDQIFLSEQEFLAFSSAEPYIKTGQLRLLLATPLPLPTVVCLCYRYCNENSCSNYGYISTITCMLWIKSELNTWVAAFMVKILRFFFVLFQTILSCISHNLFMYRFSKLGINMLYPQWHYHTVTGVCIFGATMGFPVKIYHSHLSLWSVY